MLVDIWNKFDRHYPQKVSPYQHHQYHHQDETSELEVLQIRHALAQCYHDIWPIR